MAKKVAFNVPEWKIDDAYENSGRGWCKMSKSPLLYSNADIVINVSDVDISKSSVDNMSFFCSVNGFEDSLKSLINKFSEEKHVLCGKEYPGNLGLLRKMYLYKKSKPWIATLFISSKNIIPQSSTSVLYNLHECLRKLFSISKEKNLKVGFKEGCSEYDIFEKVSKFNFWQAVCTANYECNCDVKVIISRG